MNIFNLLLVLILSYTGNLDTDVFIHSDGTAYYNTKFSSIDIVQDEIIKIVILSSYILKNKKSIIPVKDIKVFSQYGDNIIDSTIRTIDSTILYIGSSFDKMNFTFSFLRPIVSLRYKNNAMIYPFNFYFDRDSSISNNFCIYLPKDFTYSTSLSDTSILKTDSIYIRYSAVGLKKLKNYYIKTDYKQIEKNNYSLFQFYFSLFGAYLIPIFLLLILLYNKHINRNRITYIPDVVVYKPPKNLRPAEMNFILNDILDINGFISIFYDLARRGYINIVKIKNRYHFQQSDYLITLLKNYYNDNSLKRYDTIVMGGLFPMFGDKKVYLSDRIHILNKKFDEVTGEISQQLNEYNYYIKDPMYIRMLILSMGIIITIIGTLMLIFNLYNNSSIPAYQHHISLSTVISGLLISIFNSHFNLKTSMGNYTKAEIFGFREYLFRTEKSNIDKSIRNNEINSITTYALALGYKSAEFSELGNFLIIKKDNYNTENLSDFIGLYNTIVCFCRRLFKL
ncbi:hypothetical protein DRP43_00140 [candidate division TA06 bacterium]|uniref:Predicted membrane protein YciQ-like C-terminal domain-containing protein n=1 Tax=candidate division TA06 bacterium TaxID=2250710 RepID=A0A660SPE4_UNCT6|nr:MAG: hypothetical protein DRP43_00140 [candidate division TA06 bacterium]